MAAADLVAAAARDVGVAWLGQTRGRPGCGATAHRTIDEALRAVTLARLQAAQHLVARETWRRRRDGLNPAGAMIAAAVALAGLRARACAHQRYKQNTSPHARIFGTPHRGVALSYGSDKNVPPPPGRGPPPSWPVCDPGKTSCASRRRA
jgi:hypothetical protein